MKLLNLPTGYDYEYQKAVKRIPMNRHVHFIQAHIDSKVMDNTGSIAFDDIILLDLCRSNQ